MQVCTSIDTFKNHVKPPSLLQQRPSFTWRALAWAVIRQPNRPPLDARDSGVPGRVRNPNGPSAVVLCLGEAEFKETTFLEKFGKIRMRLFWYVYNYSISKIKDPKRFGVCLVSGNPPRSRPNAADLRRTRGFQQRHGGEKPRFAGNWEELQEALNEILDGHVYP